MKKHLFPASLLLAASLLPGCATEEPGMRAGIQDPIERHKESAWESVTHFPRELARSLRHAADGNTAPSNDSL